MAAQEGRMELECTMDEQDVIVLDNGSGYLKVGFSGEDAPRAVLPTVVATTCLVDDAREDEHTVGVDSTTAQRKCQQYFGEEALQQQGATAHWPVQRGQVVMQPPSKDALESLWEHTWRNVLGVEQEELPVLIADTLPLGQASYPSRQWIAEIMFEKLKVKSLAIFNTAVLSLFSTGQTRGLVIESGEGITQAVPVFEGYAIPHAIFKMQVAGQDITAKVQERMLHEHGREHSENLSVMQLLKEKVCTVAGSHGAATKVADNVDEEAKSFELPDGKIIQVSKAIRTGSPEVLFGDGDAQAPSLQKICHEAITTCDLDFRQELVSSIVVAGGTSMLPGLAPRLKSELASTLAGSLPDLARQVDVCVDSQRRHAAWIGGSMFASLSTFDQVAITKQEYEEGKADVRSLIARKTF